MTRIFTALASLLFAAALLFMPATAAAQSRQKPPEQVSIGAYIIDVQEIDMRTHSYRVDMWVWFRWRNPALNPSESVEFMNVFEPSDHFRKPGYDRPQKMPDGSLYMIVRDHGKFSSKFSLQQFPFDHQKLTVAIEDSLHPVEELVYVPDTAVPQAISLDPHIYVPGFNIGVPELVIEDFTYLMNFGEISLPPSSVYSRAVFTVPIARPWLATGIKVFLPLFLIAMCTALVFLVHPAYIEGRLGMVITALLTLVALQFNMSNALPDVDYMLLTDKVYLLVYVFIIAALTEVVRNSRAVHQLEYEEVLIADRRALAGLALLLCGGLIAILVTLYW